MSGHQHQATIAATPRRLAAEAAIAFDGEAGAALHRRRRRLGLTATEVGRRVGITQRQMARLELGLDRSPWQALGSAPAGQPRAVPRPRNRRMPGPSASISPPP